MNQHILNYNDNPLILDLGEGIECQFAPMRLDWTFEKSKKMEPKKIPLTISTYEPFAIQVQITNKCRYT